MVAESARIGTVAVRAELGSVDGGYDVNGVSSDGFLTLEELGCSPTRNDTAEFASRTAETLVSVFFSAKGVIITYFALATVPLCGLFSPSPS